MEGVNKVQLKALIAQNEVEEAISRLLELASSRQDRELYNTVVLLSNRWEQYEMKLRKAIANEAELNLLHNQITHNLLEIIDELDAKKNVPSPAPRPVSNEKQRFFLGLGALVLLAVVAYVMLDKVDSSGATEETLESRQKEFQEEEDTAEAISTLMDKQIYLPETQKVSFVDSDRTTFEIVKSELKQGDDRHYLLYLTVRCTTTKDVSFWSSNFRIQADELPGALPPLNDFNKVVKKGTYMDEQLVFDLPVGIHHFLLAINSYEKERSILMLIEKESVIAREKEMGIEPLPSKKVVFLNQKEVTLPFASNYTITYKIAKDTIEYADATKLLLTLTVGATTNYPPGISFWDDNFRLTTDLLPGAIAPVNYLNEIIEHKVYKEGTIIFEIDATTSQATLLVTEGKVERKIEMKIE